MQDTKYAPLIVFAYRRRDKIEKCIESLEHNSQSIISSTDLFIFSDGNKSDEDKNEVDETREYIDEYLSRSSFRHVNICKSEQNKGLAKSIIEGVTEVINEYGRTIVVEDDLIVSYDFLAFMNEALDFYMDCEEIGQINGYTYPISALEKYDKDVYFLKKGDCWGWATWADRWDDALWADINYKSYLSDKSRRKGFDALESGWDYMMIAQSRGEIDSWAVRWVYNLYVNNLYAVYPRVSRVSNIGFDGSGTHGGQDKYSLDIRMTNDKVVFEKDIYVDADMAKQAARYPRGNKILYLLKRVYRTIRSLV